MVFSPWLLAKKRKHTSQPKGLCSYKHPRPLVLTRNTYFAKKCQTVSSLTAPFCAWLGMGQILGVESEKKVFFWNKKQLKRSTSFDKWQHKSRTAGSALPLKRFVNHPREVVNDALEGYLWTHPNVQLLDGYPEAVLWWSKLFGDFNQIEQRILHGSLLFICNMQKNHLLFKMFRQIVSKNCPPSMPQSFQVKVLVSSTWQRDSGQVAILSGGGSGHEPADAGMIPGGWDFCLVLFCCFFCWICWMSFLCVICCCFFYDFDFGIFWICFLLFSSYFWWFSILSLGLFEIWWPYFKFEVTNQCFCHVPSVHFFLTMLRNIYCMPLIVLLDFQTITF